MIEVEIPKDIRKYEAKLVSAFTTRELIGLVIGGGCAALTYYLVSKVIGGDIAGFLSMASAVPGLAFGWVKPYGMPIERFIQSCFITAVLAPSKRKYQRENLEFRETRDGQILKMTSKEKRKRKKKQKKSKDKDLRPIK